MFNGFTDCVKSLNTQSQWAKRETSYENWGHRLMFFVKYSRRLLIQTMLRLKMISMRIPLTCVLAFLIYFSARLCLIILVNWSRHSCHQFIRSFSEFMKKLFFVFLFRRCCRLWAFWFTVDWRSDVLWKICRSSYRVQSPLRKILFLILIGCFSVCSSRRRFTMLRYRSRSQIERIFTFHGSQSQSFAYCDFLLFSFFCLLLTLRMSS